MQLVHQDLIDLLNYQMDSSEDLSEVLVDPEILVAFRMNSDIVKACNEVGVDLNLPLISYVPFADEDVLENLSDEHAEIACEDYIDTDILLPYEAIVEEYQTNNFYIGDVYVAKINGRGVIGHHFDTTGIWLYVNGE